MRMKAAVISCVAALNLCCPANCRAQSSLPHSIEAIRPSIVKLGTVCIYSDGSKQESSGTGFFVARNGLLLSAEHVVSCSPVEGLNAGALIRIELKAGLPNDHQVADQNGSRNTFSYLPVEVLEIDKQHGLALLRALTNPFTRELKSEYTMSGTVIKASRPGIARLSKSVVREGQLIAVSGYPLDYSALVTNAGIVASTKFSNYWDSQSENVHLRVAFDLFQADMRVNHGNSGGPVYYAATGEVIGVCSEMKPTNLENFSTDGSRPPYGYNSGISIVIPIGYSWALINKHISD